jgi:hypothetical protein
MVSKSKTQKKATFAPWCPKCAWYKGLHHPQCPRCGFNETTGKIETIEAEKPTPTIPESKKEVVRKSSSLFLILLLVGVGAAYVGYQIMQTTGPSKAVDGQGQITEPTTIPSVKEKTDIEPSEETPTVPSTTVPLVEETPDEDTEDPPETPTVPSTTVPPVEETPNEDTEEPPETPSQTALQLEAVSGSWTIVAGNLSTFPSLHFIGDGEFNADGTYTLNTNPVEFARSEGVIVYTGRYSLEGLEIKGGGKSTIYQGGAVFGRPATDTLTAQMDPFGKKMVGEVESTSSFHDGGGGEGIAIFEFVLERE